MNSFRLQVGLAIVVLALVGESLAQSTVPPMPPGWITIARSGGCKTWIAVPNPVASVTWTGECVAGQATGRGVLQWMLNGNATDRYEGDMSKGKMHGNGVLQYADGRRYEGMFRDGMRSGRGTLT